MSESRATSPDAILTVGGAGVGAVQQTVLTAPYRSAEFPVLYQAVLSVHRL
jgi:hypothetical protein